MLHFEEPRVRKLLMKGNVGLEKEALRITGEGAFAGTAHPFPDNPNIVRDFCENQLEINTGVSPDAEGALAELAGYEKIVRRKLYEKKDREYLWPFSNPPRIRNEEEIPIASFTGDEVHKTVYRKHLARVYGRYKMTFSGIHVNYSFDEDLLKENYAYVLKGQEKEKISYKEYKNRIYLDLTSNLIENGWIITVLLAASPLLDGTFLTQEENGKTDFVGMSSVRCSELGYWNHFVPAFDLGSLAGYAASIEKYIDQGWIMSQSELYYPVRLKSPGQNDLTRLVEEGVDHIELRNVDVNPYAFAGIELNDLKFIQLLLIYDACISPPELTGGRQIMAVANYKAAARYDIDLAGILTRDGQVISVRKAALALLSRIEAFYREAAPECLEVISFQKAKLTKPGRRYADRVMKEYREDFFRKGLARIKEEQHDLS